jgi:hypothetical protein
MLKASRKTHTLPNSANPQGSRICPRGKDWKTSMRVLHKQQADGPGGKLKFNNPFIGQLCIQKKMNCNQ